MKKTLIGFVVLLACSIGQLCAQDVAVATLEHDGNVSVYYGGSALQQAHAAAVHGDVITLSAGTFSAVNITKAIMLRGAGYVTDVAKNRYPTVLTNDFTISIKDKTDKRLAIEGVYHNSTITQTDTLTAANFSKCRFCIFELNGQSINCSFLSCRIANRFYLDINSENLFFSHCIITYLEKNSTAASVLFTNCIITVGGYNDVTNVGAVTAIYKNCIFINNHNNSNNKLNIYSTAYYNVFSNPSSNHTMYTGDPSKCVINVGNIWGKKNCEVFGESVVYGYSDTDSYSLAEGNDTIFLGTDGTQVGLYGGAIPFSDVPSTPQITRKNIASRTTVDGKLSVDIKVEVQK